MIELPEFERAWEFENAFYLTSDPTRLAKVVAEYELFKMTADVPGDIVELGVFKGTSLVRLITLRELLASPFSRRIVGFDTFGDHADTADPSDHDRRQHFVQEAGDQAISETQLLEVLEHKGINRNVKLVSGDITESLPRFLAEEPEFRCSLVSLDIGFAEPARAALEHLWPRLSQGGVFATSSYGSYVGETTAVEEYFADMPIPLERFAFAGKPAFLVKR